MQTLGAVDAQCLNFEQELALVNFQLPLVDEHLLGSAGLVVDELGGEGLHGVKIGRS
jgi:hypothetical protein